MDVGWGGKTDRHGVEGNAAFLQPAGHVDGILALYPGEVADDHGASEGLAREAVHRILNGIANLGGFALCQVQGSGICAVVRGFRGGPWILAAQL